MSTDLITSFHQHHSRSSKVQEQEVRIPINGNKEIKGSLFTDDVSAYPENTNESTD